MAQTFSGPVAGYSTVGQAKDTPTQRPPPPASTPTSKPEPKTTSVEEKKQPTTTKERTEKSSMPTVIRESNTLTSVDSVIAKATADPSMSRSTTLGDSELSSTLGVPSSSSTADSSTSDKGGDQGPSAGAKAGIAFGVLGGLLLVGLLVFFLVNRRRKAAAEREQIDDDEKFHAAVAPSASPFEPASVSRADPKAPRISLRPVTQFLPNWNGLDNKRSSKGAGMMLGAGAAGAAGGASARAVGGSAWERPGTSQSTNPANPFGNQAERVPSPIREERNYDRSGPSPVSGPVTPVSGSPPRPEDPLTAIGPVIAAAAVAGTAAAAGAATGLARKTSMRHGGPKNVDLTLPPPPGPMPPSPAGTEFSVSSMPPGTAAPASNGAAAIAAAGGPQNSAVHRVQLDFQPTLEDEMGLKAGELVRLLHEYDDGWVRLRVRDSVETNVLTPTGPCHSPGSLAAGCCASNLPVHPPSQAPPSSRSRATRTSGGPQRPAPRTECQQRTASNDSAGHPARWPTRPPRISVSPAHGAARPSPGLAGWLWRSTPVAHGHGTFDEPGPASTVPRTQARPPWPATKPQRLNPPHEPARAEPDEPPVLSSFASGIHASGVPLWSSHGTSWPEAGPRSGLLSGLPS